MDCPSLSLSTKNLSEPDRDRTRKLTNMHMICKLKLLLKTTHSFLFTKTQKFTFFRDPNYLYCDVNLKFSFVHSTNVDLHGALEA